MNTASTAEILTSSICLRQAQWAWIKSIAKGGIPSRQSLDPRDLSGIIEKTFILEARSEHEFRIRICGQAVCNQIGMEMRGMPAVSMFDLPDRQTLTGLFHTICTGKHYAVLDISGVACGNKGSVILLPMRGPDGSVSRILGAVDLSSQAFPPNRFSVHDIFHAPVAEMVHQRELTDTVAAPAPGPFSVISGGRNTGIPSRRPRPKLTLVS